MQRRAAPAVTQFKIDDALAVFEKLLVVFVCVRACVYMLVKEQANGTMPLETTLKG